MQPHQSIRKMKQNMTIFLENQKVFAHIGWGEGERNQGVVLWVDIKTTFDWEDPKDDLLNTLDYAKLVEIAHKEAKGDCRLLETYAARMLNAVLEESSNTIKKISIVIRKKNLPVTGYDADAAGVNLEWEI